MKRIRIFIALLFYVAILLVTSIGVPYLLTSHGLPISIGVTIGCLLFFVSNGTLLYLGRRVKAIERGEEPPRWGPFMFGLVRDAEGVRVPRSARVLLGLLFVVGGALLIALGVFLAFIRPPSNVLQILIMAILIAMGLGIGYSGWRLIVVRDGQRLFGRANAGSVP